MSVLEQQPLLNKEKPRGLPWSQIIILGLFRVTHAIYFGYILTCDAIGRKATASAGVLLASIGTIAFGFSSTLPQMIALRFSIGFFVSFIPATIITSLIELSNAETLPTAFAVSSVAWTTGTVIAPGIGGFLAEPARHYPGLFKGTIWEVYPYALSGVVAASVPILSTIIGYFVLEETLPIERRRSLFSLFSRNEDLQEASLQNNQQKRIESGSWKELLTRPVCFMLCIWGLFIHMIVLHLVAEVLFLSSPESVGGLQLSPREMAILYSIRPLLGAALNMLLYPVLARRWSAEAILKWCFTFILPFYYLGYFVLGYVASHPAVHLGHSTLLTSLFVLALLNVIDGCSQTATGQTLSSRAPSRAHLSKLNTLSEYTANTAHGMGALVGCNVWALGVRHHILRSQLVWVILFGLAVVLAAMSRRVTKMKTWQELEEEIEPVEAS